jgi:hypothetical protein
MPHSDARHQSIIEALMHLLGTADVRDKQVVVRVYAPLLLDEAAELALVDLLDRYAQDHDAVRAIEAHRTLLGRCREVGIDAAFEELHVALDDAQRQEQLVMIANNTVAVLTTASDQRVRWLAVVQEVRALAGTRGDAQMQALMAAVERLLSSGQAAQIRPALAGDHAACWAAIVEALGRAQPPY